MAVSRSHVAVLALLAHEAVSLAVEPLPDVPYEEIVSHRSTFLGATAIEGWSSLPFTGPVLQATSARDGGAFVRTAAGMWSTADGVGWAKAPSQLTAGATLLEGAADMVVDVDGVYRLDCSGGGASCKSTLVAKIDAKCASSVSSGWSDAATGAIAVGCGSGLYLGKARVLLPLAG
jgi:hypothetical protein